MLKNQSVIKSTNSSHAQLTSLLGLLLLALLCTVSAYGQVLYGSLTGTVEDSSGAAVSGAKVVALNVSTGVTHSATSDASGIYRFTTLLPGAYKITISAPNFASQVTENVRVSVNTVARVDGRLKVAQANENVTVTTEAPLLQTDRADLHTDLSAAEIRSLPAISSEGKSFQALYKIIPGASLPMENNSAGGNPQRAMTSNVNGQSSQGNNTRIDGVQDAYPWLPNNIAYVPPADAIQTVNVVTNSFDAEQGNAGAAAMNVTIKSGTNQFHGSAWEYHSNSALKARNYFYCLYSCPGGDPNRPPKNIQNQPGATLGGPIKKNKLFFFASWEKTVRRINASALQSLPSEQMKNGIFTSYSANIYDPETGNADGSARTLFPNKTIPA